MLNNQNTTLSLYKILPLLKFEKKFLIIVGKSSYKNNLFYKELFHNFKPHIYLIKVKDYLPLFKTAKLISRKINSKNISYIIAIGGGTVIDIAKLVKLLYVSKTSNFHFLQKKLNTKNNKEVNLIVAPTTAGSGAEATQFCVSFYYRKKTSISHSIILPNYIYFNPISLLSNSKINKQSSGLDAFSQCIESLLSINSTRESSSFALKGLRLILKNFEKYIKNGDIKSAKYMQIAANLSGRAINISKTSAPHAFSYYLTSHHKIPHGIAVAIFLPYFFYLLVDNFKQIKDKKTKINLKKIIMEFSSYSNNKNFFQNFYHDIGFKQKYSSLLNDNYNLTDFDRYINIERLNNFPLNISKYGSRNILENIFSTNTQK